MMRLPIEKHLIYEIYPEVLANWFSQQPIEEQALFLATYLSEIDCEKMSNLSKEFVQYRYAGIYVANDLSIFAKRALDALKAED